MHRLKSEYYIQAYLRRCQAAGAFATIAKRGHEEAGIMAIKIFAEHRQATGFIESRDDQGNLAWRPLSDGLVDEFLVDERLAKEQKFDPDLWIVEIEDRAGRHFLEEKILPIHL